MGSSFAVILSEAKDPMAGREIAIETKLVPSGIDGLDQRDLPIAPPSLDACRAR